MAVAVKKVAFTAAFTVAVKKVAQNPAVLAS